MTISLFRFVGSGTRGGEIDTLTLSAEALLIEN